MEGTFAFSCLPFFFFLICFICSALSYVLVTKITALNFEIQSNPTAVAARRMPGGQYQGCLELENAWESVSAEALPFRSNG